MASKISSDAGKDNDITFSTEDSRLAAITEEPSIVKQRFEERLTYLTDPIEYPRDKKEPGLVLIFNQTFAKTEKERKGSNFDVIEFVNTLGRLGYNVDKNHVKNDCTRAQILSFLKYIVTTADVTDCNCLILAFFTHGHNDNLLDTDDAPIKANELWEMFDKCANLRGKPKLFLIQACKGENITCIDSIETDEHGNNMNLVSPSFFHTFIPPDVLLVFATREGAVSWRDEEKGSWFIQEFCKNAMAYGKIEDVFSIVTRTTKCVANTYYLAENQVICKQMPTTISTLTRKFYLTNSKHRQFLLEELKRKDEIIKQLKLIEEKAPIN